MNTHQFFLPKRKNPKEEIMQISVDTRTRRFPLGFPAPIAVRAHK
jgi:hypothetical protein